MAVLTERERKADEALLAALLDREREDRAAAADRALLKALGVGPMAEPEDRAPSAALPQGGPAGSPWEDRAAAADRALLKALGGGSMAEPEGRAPSAALPQGDPAAQAASGGFASPSRPRQITIHEPLHDRSPVTEAEDRYVTELIRGLTGKELPPTEGAVPSGEVAKRVSGFLGGMAGRAPYFSAAGKVVPALTTGAALSSSLLGKIGWQAARGAVTGGAAELARKTLTGEGTPEDLERTVVTGAVADPIFSQAISWLLRRFGPNWQFKNPKGDELSLDDAYAALGLKKGASPEEVRSAWRAAAKQYHPDMSTGNEELFRKATTAYERIRSTWQSRGASSSDAAWRESGPVSRGAGGAPAPARGNGGGAVQPLAPESPMATGAPGIVPLVDSAGSRGVESVPVQVGEGHFGPVWEAKPGDSEGAIRLLMKQKAGEVQGAAFREDTGPIDFVYGVAGDPEREFGGGYGLAHIEAKHGPEALAAVPEILRTGKIEHKGSRIEVHAPDGIAAVRLDWDGEAKTWLVTSYFPNIAKDPRPDRTSTIVGHVGESSSPNEGLNKNIAQSSVDDNITTTDKDHRPERTIETAEHAGESSIPSPDEGLPGNTAQLTEGEKGRAPDLAGPSGRAEPRTLRAEAPASVPWKSVELDGRLYDVNEDVNLEDPVQVLPLEWKGLPKLPDNKRWMFRKSEALKKAIQKIADEVFSRFGSGVQSVRYPEYVLELTRSGLNHVVHTAVNRGEAEGNVLLAALPNLDTIVKNAYKVRTHKDRYQPDDYVPKVDDVRQVHRFFAPVRFEGKDYTLKITVMELENGVQEIGPLRVYDQTVTRKMPEGPSPSFGSTSLSPETTVPTGNVISVGDMINGVKDLMVHEEPSQGKDVASGVPGEVYGPLRTTLSGSTLFQSDGGVDGSERSTPSSSEPSGGEEVPGKGASNKSVKRQKALEHKAEERERAREFGNAPEDPFGGAPATEADIDDMFADGAWSFENMADMAREFDEAFNPKRDSASRKGFDLYDSEGRLIQSGGDDGSYVDPLSYYAHSPSIVAEKYEEFRPFFDLAKQAMKLQEDLRREFGKVLDEAWGSLSESQSQRLNDLLLEGDLQGKTFTEEQLLSKGADEAVRKGYRLIRELSDRVGKTIRRRQKASGAITMGWREGYVPHIFHAFWVQVDGKIVATARSLREAVELARDAEARHGSAEVRIVSKPNDLSQTARFWGAALKDKWLLRMSSRLEEAFSFSREEAEGYLSGRDGGVFKNRIFKFAHERLGAGGWDRDMRFAFRHYMNQAGRFLAMDELKFRGTTLFEKMWGNFDHEYTGMAKYAKDYLNDVLGVPSHAAVLTNRLVSRIPGLNRVARHVFGWNRPAESLAAVLTKTTAVHKLGFWNVGAAVMNLSQLLNAASVLGYDEVRLGLVEYFHPNERTKRVYEETGVEYDLNLSAGAGYSKASERLYGKLGALGEESMALFTYMDGMCRKATVLAAYRQATRKGMSHKEAIAFARKTNDRTNFDYSVADAPNFIRRSGPIGQVLFQFKKFGVKQLEFALGLKTLGERTRFWVPMLALSGLFGLPGTDLLVSLFRALFDRDPQLEVNAWLAKNSSWIPEPVRRTIQYGLLSNVGIDMSRRVGMGDVIPNQWSDLAGPTLGTLARLAGPAATLAGMLFGLDGDANAALLNALEAVSPGLSNPIKALLGEVADKQRGRLRFSYTGGERIARATGFRPTREAVESDAVRTARYVEQKRGERERAAIDEYARARERGDDAAAARALVKVRELRIEPRRLIEEMRLRRRGTAYDRMVHDLRSPRRREAREVLVNY